MSKTIWWIIALVAIVAVVGFLTTDRGTGRDDSAVKIGVLAPLTGDGAQQGNSVLTAIQVAVAQINDDDGIGGKQIELVVEDGKCDPQAAATAAQKLVTIDEVRVIIGGVCAGETLSAATITEPAQVILISPGSPSPDVTAAGDFVFRTYPSDALAGQIAASYAYHELGARTAALMSELTDYAQGLREAFTATFEELGGEIVGNETYDTGEVDFEAHVAEVKSAGPDLVYLILQSSTSGVAIVEELRANEVDAAYMTTAALFDPVVVLDNSDALEGIYGVEPGIDWVNNPKAAALMEAHQDMFGSEPGAFSANAYDAMYLIALAIENHGLDTVAIRDYLYQVKNWPGAVGPLTIDVNGDPELNENIRFVTGGQVTDLGVYAP